MRRPILLVATGAVTTALVVTSVVGSLHNKKSDQGDGANTSVSQKQVVKATCPDNRYAVVEKASPTGSYVEGGVTVTNGDPKKALVEFIDQRAHGYPGWIAMATKTLVDPSTNVKQKQKQFTTECGGKKYLSLEGQEALKTLSAVAKGAEVTTITTAEGTWTSGLGSDGTVVGAKSADDGKEAMKIASTNGRTGEMTLACANWHVKEGDVPTGTLPRVPVEPATPPTPPQTPPNHDGGDVKIAAPWNGGAARSVDNGRSGYKATPAAKTPQVVANGSGAKAPLPSTAAGGTVHGAAGGANYGGAQPRPSNAPSAEPAGEVKPPTGMEGM